ncbi:MAG: hypothetical protein HYU99_00035 [Deltaproteobacteria bacterium]|nr:hypothetical protein [Deltaproteobacteria bacterium]
MHKKQRGIKKVFLVFKRSLFQKKISLHRRHPLARRLYKEHVAHSRTIQKIREELKKHGIRFTATSRHKLPPLNRYDLVITVGGDGTFLRASHRVTRAHRVTRSHGVGRPAAGRQLMLGVNSNPASSVGALCSMTLEEFPKKLKGILEGGGRTRRLNRLEIRVNGKNLRHLALNDVLFCNTQPGGTSRYTIAVGGKKEEQKSSGVWISTSSGSTAAIHAAGGKIMPLFSPQMQFLVREPYRGRHPPYRITGGMISPGRSIRFINLMLHAALYIDGLQLVCPLRYGDRISIRNSPNPLTVIV